MRIPCDIDRWLLAALLLTAGCRKPADSGVLPTKRLETLAAELALVRTVEPRLSGGFLYAPCDATAAGGVIAAPHCPAAPGLLEHKELAELYRAALTAKQKSPDPASLHAAGWFELLLSHEGDSLDGAVERLSAAETSTAPTYLNDLAVAYMVRGQREDRPLDLIRALEVIERAAAIAPQDQEVVFNLALIHDRLGLMASARESWERYLSLDSSSPWTTEARQALARLTAREEDVWSAAQLQQLDRAMEAADDGAVLRQLVERFSQPAREKGQEELLEAWTTAQLGGRSDEAAAVLRRVSALAEAILAVRGDPFLRDAVTAITATADKGRLVALVEGHHLLRQGLAQRSAGDIEAAETALEKAHRLLTPSGSPLAFHAELFAAICRSRSDYAVALERLETLISDPKAREYPSLRLRALWMAAVLRGVRGRPSLALAGYREALELATQLGETDATAFLHSLVAARWLDLGQEERSWRHHFQALVSLGRVREPSRRVEILTLAADAALAGGQREAALRFKGEELRLSRQAEEPILIVDSSSRRARLLRAVGRSREALADLAAARALLPDIADPGTRGLLLARIDLEEGSCLASSDPQAAISLLERAVGQLTARDHRLLLVDALIERARALRQAGLIERAEVDLANAVDEVERQREAIHRSGLRISFLDRWQTTFDEAVKLFLDDLAAPGRALDYAERGRLRGLLDLIDALESELTPRYASQSRPLEHDGMLAALGPGTTLVEYAVLADEIVAWVLEKDRPLQLIRTTVRAEKVEKAVDELRRTLATAKTDAGSEEPALWLHERLIAPVLKIASPGTSLVIVPDKALFALPFAALVERATGRYLIEQRALIIAPSASVYLRARKRREHRAAADRTLVMAAPAHGDVPWLKELPAAASEGRAVAALYPGSELLLDMGATEAALLERASQIGRLHIASHATRDPDDPSRWFLVLAPEPAGGGDGRLYPEEIMAASFSGADLVVLGACSTATGELSSTEGPLSLARAFLAAGTSAVVASLWSVDDQATAHLLIRFHELLRRGETPARALQQVQVEGLRASSEQRGVRASWPALQLIGAAP